MEALRAVGGSAIDKKSGEVFGSVGNDRRRASESAVAFQKPFSEENLKDAVKQANKLSLIFDRSLKFEYRQEADIYQVSVIDTSKNEVVRKIPPDEIVRFIESIKDMFGAMIDVTA